MSDKYEQSELKHTTIIAFQRYIPEIQAIFLYAYDSKSLIIIEQYHIDINELKSNLNKYYEVIERFVTRILDSN